VSRSSGRLGCVNLVPGAGLTHALSGIAEAFMDQVPLLVLCCGVRADSGRAYQLHDIAQLEVARPVSKAQFRVTEGGAIAQVLREACRIARRAPPGPVVVEVPADLMAFRHAPTPREAAVAEDVPKNPPPDIVARAAARLAAARRPLLYLGNGCVGAPQADLVALAERLQAPVATTIQGKGLFPERHPLWLWCGFGAATPSFVRRIASACDATLAIGCRFAEVATGSYGIAPPRPLIHVDVDSSVFDRNFSADLAVESDAAVFLAALLPELPARRPDGDLHATIVRGHEEVHAAWVARPAAGAVSGARLMTALQSGFGPDTVYVADSGNGQFVAMECLRLERPRRFLAPVDFSCMGYALPAAIGAALANPGTPAVAVMGDGAFLMTGLELLTAAQLEVPVALFVLRDRELTQIAQFQDTAFARRCASDLPDFDLSDLCRGLGVAHLAIATEADLDEGVARVREGLTQGPVVAEVVFDNTQRTYFTRGVVRTNFGRLPWSERLHFAARALGRRARGR
jgi:acetolactate synthase-1/2/3 large subunit